MQTKEFTAAIYCRVAHEDQSSLDIQKERLCVYANENSFDNLSFYLDNGYNGLKYDRPAFSKLEADIKAGLVDEVITLDISRVGRNCFEVVSWVEQLRRNGILFIEASLSSGDNIIMNMGCFKKAYAKKNEAK